MSHSVAVLGAGSWGTALACLLAGNGQPTVLWSHSPEHAAACQSGRHNPRYLPELRFPTALEVTAELGAAVAVAEWILVATPSRAFAPTLSAVAPFLRTNTPVAWATKGLEPQRGVLLHEVARDLLPAAGPLAVVSGPSFAGEVARGLPTAVTVASSTPAFAWRVAEALHNPRFRVYAGDDVTGVEVGGAVKNILAIAAGVSDGLGFGSNARAALITRGLTEMTRLGLTLGARAETFMGLAGLGDLVLTCTDDQSRNRRVGLALAAGQSLAEALQRIGQEAEGVPTTGLVRALAQARNVDMPICEQTYSLLYQHLPPEQAVRNLLERALRFESIADMPAMAGA